LTAYSTDRFVKAVRVLLDRVAEAGELRAEIGPEDLLRAVIGMCILDDQPGWQASALRVVDVFVDGLCGPEARRGSAPNPARGRAPGPQ
jgi:hypothetical protein